jgi:hypothetical protein
MENEYNQRAHTTRIQYDRVQNQLRTLTNTLDRTSQKLSSVHINEKMVIEKKFE